MKGGPIPQGLIRRTGLGYQTSFTLLKMRYKINMTGGKGTSAAEKKKKTKRD